MIAYHVVSYVGVAYHTISLWYAMTSRDIQITLKRSREHTSRLMKKLFEDGYVQRNVESKPYTYSITQKGIAKIENLQTSPTVN